MLGITVPGAGERPGLSAGAGVNHKPPRHAEMHDEALPRRKPGDQVFAAPIKRVDLSALKAAGEIRRQGITQIGPAELDAGENPALHDRGEAPANDFDFGKLGHAADDKQTAAGAQSAQTLEEFRTRPALCIGSPRDLFIRPEAGSGLAQAADADIDGSQTDTRLRPAFFAAYIAASARSIDRSTGMSGSSKTSPNDAVI